MGQTPLTAQCFIYFGVTCFLMLHSPACGNTVRGGVWWALGPAGLKYSQVRCAIVWVKPGLCHVWQESHIQDPTSFWDLGHGLVQFTIYCFAETKTNRVYFFLWCSSVSVFYEKTFVICSFLCLLMLCFSCFCCGLLTFYDFHPLESGIVSIFF